MAKFKCILSGNIIEFTQQVDIDSMKGHEGYVQVEEQEPVKVAPVATKKTSTNKAATPVEAE